MFSFVAKPNTIPGLCQRNVQILCEVICRQILFYSITFEFVEELKRFETKTEGEY